jgi:hypothetical protein
MIMIEIKTINFSERKVNNKQKILLNNWLKVHVHVGRGKFSMISYYVRARENTAVVCNKNQYLKRAGLKNRIELVLQHTCIL